MSSPIDELREQIAQCDREIFALEERKRELRRNIRIAVVAEKDRRAAEKLTERLSKKNDVIRRKLLQ